MESFGESGKPGGFGQLGEPDKADRVGETGQSDQAPNLFFPKGLKPKTAFQGDGKAKAMLKNLFEIIF